MPAPRVDAHDLKAVKSRLDEIVNVVSDDSISLDDALAYYEEAVKLGMKASEIMEADLIGPADGEGDDASTAESSDEGGAAR